jgi:hypothetical protein
MAIEISTWLKPDIKAESLEQENDIFLYMNNDFVSGDNQKYMKMYDWMSYVYDFGEKWIGRLKFGRSLDHMRTELMSRLEWRNNISVLYVSIGTGTDLSYLPQGIDLKTIDMVGADISMGMLKRCKKKWQKKTNLTLVQCPAEELPFADNTFDIVFHNGAINFFNDKARAMSEMLRVAKAGSKILVADETADFVESQYKKSIFSKSYFEGKTVDLHEIEQCIPPSAGEKQTELFWDNRFYGITFRKSMG